MSAIPKTVPADDAPRKPSMSRNQRLLFFLTAWLICLMPFLFWWNTWFGRKLSDAQLTEYLHDTKKPRHIQQALVQVGERITRQDATAKQWYPDLVRLASDPVEEVRNTDAWVMGQDTSGPGFHDTLLKMLTDSSQMVRGNAALSLVRFGDTSGRPQILALLQPAQIAAHEPGRVIDADRPGTAIREGGLIAKIDNGHGKVEEIRSPIPGRIRSVVGTGANINAWTPLAVVDPANEQVWEALRALYLIGQPEDLPMIRPYERDLPDISNDVRRQAAETEQAIQKRAGSWLRGSDQACGRLASDAGILSVIAICRQPDGNCQFLASTDRVGISEATSARAIHPKPTRFEISTTFTSTRGTGPATAAPP